jgi:hypothetical protein
MREKLMVDASSPVETRMDYRTLYYRAFEAHGAAALWNKARIEDPTPEHALVIARALRLEGDRQARQLAEDIEKAAKDALGAAL